MDLRVTIEQFTRLQDCTTRWNATVSDVVRRAVRKWDRLGVKLPVELFKNKKCSTNKMPLRIKIRNFETTKKPEELRQIITWYLNDQEAKELPIAPIQEEKSKTGYVLISHEKYERGQK